MPILRTTNSWMPAAATIVLASLFFFIRPLEGQLRAPRTRGNAGSRYFTVKDSIEMARFERARRQPEFSPDREYFAVVTSRGLLRSNQIESSLWIFRSRDVRESLNAKSAKRVCPKVVARLRAIPQLDYSDSYQSLITDVEWLPDSKTILFLGQGSGGRRRLCRTNVESGAVQTLTSEDYDVVEFKVGRNNIIYEAARAAERQNRGASIGSDPRSVTGMGLVSILFSSTAKTHGPLELWVLRNGKNHQVKDAKTGQTVRVPDLPPPPYDVLSSSSDGKSAVVLVPCKTIPPLWENYLPAFSYLGLQSSYSEADTEFWPSEYALVDLPKGETAPLVNAPNAWALGSADMNQAVWSPDGRKLLLTNTYLPLQGIPEPERSSRLRPCAAAVINLASKTCDCMVFSTWDRGKKYLLGGTFRASNEEVSLRFWNFPNRITEQRFRYENGAWHSTNQVAIRVDSAFPSESSESPSGSFSVVIRQDLNTPPVLWAVDRETGQGRRIWDPNPQLAALDLGEASEFHWKDKSGYEWTGGLVKPPNYVQGKRRPLVIQTHGFEANEFISDGAFTTAFAARPLASEGILVLQMPTRHDHLVTKEEAPDQIRGMEAAIERLVADGLVDPRKVGVIGFSRTCYHVESALIHDPQMFAAATLADGVDESYIQYLLFGAGQLHDESEQIYGNPPFGEGLKAWVEHGPGFHLDRIQTPLRLEAIAPASILEEWEIYASLWKQKKPVDLIYFPHGQHILQKPRERFVSQQGNVDWFRFWLKGEEDADPRKTGQYMRWRKLR